MRSQGDAVSTDCSTPPVKAIRATVTSLALVSGGSASFNVCTQYESQYAASFDTANIVSISVGASVTDPNTGIKTATVTITGLNPGTTNVTVTDKKNNQVIVAVTVRSPVNIYVANQSNTSVTVYSGGGTGTVNASPLETIAGPDTALTFPFGIAVDASGNIYVANENHFNTVDVFSGGGTGTLDQMPLAILAGSNTGLSFPNGVAVDANGKIYVSNDFQGSGGSVTIYSGGGTGALNVAPLETITGSNTGLDFGGPSGIAVDATGKIYVTNFNSNSVMVYAGGGTGTVNATPLETIAGANTGISQPEGIAVDASGKIYVANTGGFPRSVTVYSGGGTGTVNEAPLETIGGTNTGLMFPDGVAVDANGNIYVADSAGSVMVFGGGGTGVQNVAPIETITGSNTGLAGPANIAVH